MKGPPESKQLGSSLGSPVSPVNKIWSWVSWAADGGAGWPTAVNWHKEPGYGSQRSERTELKWPPELRLGVRGSEDPRLMGRENGNGRVWPERWQMARSSDDSAGRRGSDGVWSEKRISVFPICCANANFSHFNFAYGDVSLCRKLYSTQSRKMDIWIKFP